MTAAAPGRLQVMAYHPAEGVHGHASPEEISEALASGDTAVWLDITDPQPDDERLLAEEFKLHPLAIEEVQARHPRAKCTEFPGYYVMVMYAADRPPEGELRLREVVIYAGHNFLITAHTGPFPEIEECVTRWRANVGIQDGAIAAPLYSLLDTLVDGYFPLLDQLAEEVEDIEDRLLAGTQEAGPVPSLFSLKKQFLALRRVVAGQRDALNLLLRQDVSLFPEPVLIYFQNVYDHLVRLVESIDTYRDLLSSAMDMHLTVISNRLNQVMKTLTVVSTILMSGSLVAGIYGMNFENMPELHTRYGYYAALGAIVAISGGLIALFRRLRWF